MNHYADAYLSLVDAPPESPEGQFHRRLAALDVSTANPLLLEILYQDCSDLRDAFKVIESFLVRRAVCGLTPKGYNRFFVQVLDAADKAGNWSAVFLREYLKSQSAETSLWPDDAAFRDAWISLNF